MDIDIDLDHQINAVARAVGDRTIDAGKARVVTISQTYDTDLDDLWDAVTNPKRIPRWFLPVTGDLRVGGRYQLEGNAGGTIERCHPPRSFAATWEYGDDISWIEVTLTVMAPGKTKFQLEHLAVPGDHWEQFGPGAVGIGWDLGILGLSLHLRDGATVDPAAVQAWSASDDGRRFMTQSSDGWCDADIASGADADAARAAADRTTAAYTAAG
jgi:uncharacterized protein YndB with AHSA1/START domain